MPFLSRPTTARGAVRQVVTAWAIAFAVLNGFMFYAVKTGDDGLLAFCMLLNLGLHPLAIVYGYFEILRAYTGENYDGQQYALSVAIIAFVFALTLI